jgi:serine/threonine protein kinase/tetratricopeptide (TPR) repeat protein
VAEDATEDWSWIDPVVARFEQAWTGRPRPRIEDFLAEVEGTRRVPLLVVLLRIEQERRREAGETWDPEEYHRRFPDNPGVIDAVLAEGSASVKSDNSLTVDAPPPAVRVEGPGAQIGPYRLLQLIGEGGMGVVYMAEQERPVRRRVALKIIKPGMDSRHVIARFEAERQALAMMEHQHIARVLDAGDTDSGRPYFVMELVRGVPINEYCDRNRLTPRERLELFVPVCQAIQHAHQKGIIHRDVKPSNLLVTLADGKPMAKVIDFGVAKAVDQRLTERTMFTQFGQIVGTLEYMSPEQAEMGAMDIDTRTDIYSLGVVLYELLTGSSPLERKKLREAGYAELLRRIREEETPRPSTRLSELKATLPTIGAQRKTEPAKLTKLVRGELDWIVMKALEKDRTRRYETADALARDIKRHLDGEPVEAGPPSATYRIAKFARRHRALLSTAALFLALLVLGAVASTLLAIRASRANLAASRALAQLRVEQEKTQYALECATAEEEKTKRSETEARAVLDFLQNKVMAAARPEGQEGGLGREVPLRAAIDAAERGIGESFASQPALEASIRDTLGQTYYYVGLMDKAIRQYERALALRRKALGPDNAETIGSVNNLAMAFLDSGRVAEALALLEPALKNCEAALAADDALTLVTMGNLAHAYDEAARMADALPLHRETLKRLEDKHGPDDMMTLTELNNLATAYRSAGRLAEALPLYEQTLERLQRTVGANHPNTLLSMNNLALAYVDAGRAADAIPLHEEARKRSEIQLGSDHPDTLFAIECVARAYEKAGRGADAVFQLQEALKRRQAKLGREHPETLLSMNDLAGAYLSTGKFSEAERTIRECLSLRERLLPADWTRYHTMSQLGAALAGLKKFAEAEPLLVQGYEGLQARAAAIPPKRQQHLAEAAARIVPFYEAWGIKEKGEQWRAKLTAAGQSKPRVR